MEAGEKFWRVALGVSAINVVVALLFFASPAFGVSRPVSGVWLLVSIIMFAIAKSQTRRWAEDDDLPHHQDLQ